MMLKNMFIFLIFFIFLKCSDMYFALSLIKIGDKKFHQKVVQKCLLIFLNTPCRAGLKPQAPDTLGLILKPTGSRVLLVIVSESGYRFEYFLRYNSKIWNKKYLFCSDLDESLSKIRCRTYQWKKIFC